MAPEDTVTSIEGRTAEVGGHPPQVLAAVVSTSDARTVNNTMRHQYRVLTDAEKANMQAIKDEGMRFHELVSGLGNSRETSLAKTKIEEAVMWAVKAITA